MNINKNNNHSLDLAQKQHDYFMNHKRCRSIQKMQFGTTYKMSQ